MTLPRLMPDLPAAEYHRDEIGADRPSLSASVATALLNESPRRAWLKHPKLGGGRAEADVTEEMDRGTIIHALFFGKGAEVEVIPADSYRTAAARDRRDAARAEGRTPVLEHKFADMRAVATALADAVRAAGFDLSRFRTEAVMVWEEPTALGPVLCRGMTDALRLDAGAILDLKNTSADPKRFGKKVVDFGYDLQFAAYTSALRQLNPAAAGREDFVWLLAEELPEGAPQRVELTVARPSGVLREHGRLRWARACERWARCLHTSHWPGYADGPVSIEPPGWALQEEFAATALSEE